MRYAEFPPGPPFSRIVECYWMLDGAGSGAAEPIVPDGRIELVFHYGVAFNRHHGDGRIERQGRALIAGQILEPVTLSFDGVAGVAAIRLRPWAGGPALGLDASELAHNILDLEAVFPSTSTLRERLAEAADNASRVRLLESWVAATFVRGPRPDIEAAAAAIVRSDGRADIGILASRAGVSARTFQRRFAADVGLPAKQFARVLRLQAALRHVRAGRPLADVAIACGYYDQSHMALDFAQLAASSPSAWRTRTAQLTTLFSGLA